MSLPKLKKADRRHGFTLIELIVVVGILGIVGVIVIPTVRTLNEDRKIRDTARVVGSVFAAARERAAVDGQAGVEIVAIPNASGNYNIPNMGLLLYQLRNVPPYVGDTNDATANVIDVGGELRVFASLGNDMVGAGIQVDDFLELNNNGIKLRVLDVVEITTPPADPTDDYLVIENPAPNPQIPLAALPFKIHRQPVRVRSSSVRLPNNLFLNMALSGHGVADNAGHLWKGRQFRDFQASDPPPAFPELPRATEGSTQVWFDKDGSISYVRTRTFVTSPMVSYSSNMEKPSGPVHLLMCSANDDEIDLTNLESADYLRDDNNMWITINHRTGSVTMGKMAEFDLIATGSNTLLDQIHDARSLARNRRSANP